MSEVSIGGHFSVSLGLDDKYFPPIALRILLEPLKSDDGRNGLTSGLTPICLCLMLSQLQS